MQYQLSTAEFNIIEKCKDARYRDIFVIHHAVLERFPELRIGVAVIRGVEIQRKSSDLEKLKKRITKELQEKYQDISLGSIAQIQAYREIYKSFGVDPRSRTPGAEALIHRIAKGHGVYNINNVVDAYNITSAEVAIPMGAYDLSTLSLPIELRFAREGEQHYPIGSEEPTQLNAGSLVYADQEKIVCQDFNYRDSDITKIMNTTTDVMLFVDGCGAVPHDEVQHGLDSAISRIIQFAGGELDFKAYLFKD